MDSAMDVIETETTTLRKSSRIKTNSNIISYQNLVEVKPCKRKPKEFSLEDIYLQRGVQISNLKTSSLETIYESPRSTKGLNQTSLMSIVKLKRQCKFSPYFDPSKLKRKQRKDKASKLKRIGVRVPSGTAISIERVKEALKNICENSDDDASSSLPDIPQKENVSTVVSSKTDIRALSDNMSSLDIHSICSSSKEDRVPLVTINTPPEMKLLDDFAPLLVAPSKKTSKARRRSTNQFTIPSSSQDSLISQAHSTQFVDECQPMNDIPLSVSDKSFSANNTLTFTDRRNEACPQSICIPQKRKSKSNRGFPKKIRGNRRDSGIVRPIYSHFSPESAIDSPSDDFKADICESIHRDDLNLDLSSEFSNFDTKTRRRSARLSFYRSSEPTLGTMWNNS